MMYREVRFIVPKEDNDRVKALWEEHVKYNFGSFRSYNDFLVHCLNLGLARAESSLRRSIAPSIVLPR